MDHVLALVREVPKRTARVLSGGALVLGALSGVALSGVALTRERLRGTHFSDGAFPRAGKRPEGVREGLVRPRLAVHLDLLERGRDGGLVQIHDGRLDCGFERRQGLAARRRRAADVGAHAEPPGSAGNLPRLRRLQRLAATLVELGCLARASGGSDP